MWEGPSRCGSTEVNKMQGLQLHSSQPGDNMQSKTAILQRGWQEEKEGKGCPNADFRARRLLLPQAFFSENFNYQIVRNRIILFSLAKEMF